MESKEQTRVGHTKSDPTDVYVGRGPDDADLLNTPIGDRGWLGNPFTEDEWGRAVAIGNFRQVFIWRLNADPDFREAVRDLSGKTLGCWCQRLDDDGPPCHAEVIANAADKLAAGKEVL